MKTPPLGQHWLTDEAALQSIVKLADVKAGDHVLEIGPGQGALTRHLIKAGAKVTAVEFDPQLAAKLAPQFPGKPLTVINQDILSFDLTKLPAEYKVVANIPYYLTGKLIKNLLESSHPPNEVTLLIQKEVAERLLAEPGQLSILALSALYHSQIERGPVVPAKAFSPPPKVDSRVVKLVRREKPPIQTDPKTFFQLIKAGFSAKRKKLVSALAGGLDADKNTVANAMEQAGIDTNARAQMLSIEQWDTLAQQMKKSQVI